MLEGNILTVREELLSKFNCLASNSTSLGRRQPSTLSVADQESLTISLYDDEDEYDHSTAGIMEIDGPFFRVKSAIVKTKMMKKEQEKKKQKEERKNETKRKNEEAQEERTKRSKQKKAERKQNTKQRREINKDSKNERKIEIQRRRIDGFNGRLGITSDIAQQEGLAMLLPTKQRGKSEAAINYSGYKDRICRRGVQALVEGTTGCQQMFRFGEEKKNRNPLNPRMRAVTFFIDPLCPKPMDGQRTEPLRIAVGEKGDIERVVKDLNSNSDKFIVAQDEYNVDELVFGRNVINLDIVMRRKTKRKDAEDEEVNKKLLSEIEFAEKTPLRERNSKIESDDKEVDIG